MVRVPDKREPTHPGEMLAKDTRLRVIKIESNQVFVARASKA